MENTENQYPTGCYMEVSGAGLEKATKDGWRLVRVMERPGAGASFLVRTDKAKATELDRLRAELTTAEAAYTLEARDRATDERKAAATIKELRAEGSAHELEFQRRDDREFDLVASQEAMRDRLLAQENSLNDFRQEIGRARCIEIETGKIDEARDELCLLANATRAKVVGELVELARSSFSGMDLRYFDRNHHQRTVDVVAWLVKAGDALTELGARGAHEST